MGFFSFHKSALYFHSLGPTLPFNEIDCDLMPLHFMCQFVRCLSRIIEVILKKKRMNRNTCHKLFTGVNNNNKIEDFPIRSQIQNFKSQDCILSSFQNFRPNFPLPLLKDLRTWIYILKTCYLKMVITPNHSINEKRAKTPSLFSYFLKSLYVFINIRHNHIHTHIIVRRQIVVCILFYKVTPSIFLLLDSKLLCWSNHLRKICVIICFLHSKLLEVRILLVNIWIE